MSENISPRKPRRSAVHLFMHDLADDVARWRAGDDNRSAAFYRLGWSVGGCYHIIASYNMTASSRRRWLTILRSIDAELTKAAQG